MEALQAALASLVALEARATELVSPVEAIADAVKAVVKEAAIVVESLHGRVTELEQLEARVAKLEEMLAALVRTTTDALHRPLIVHPNGDLSLLDETQVAAAAPEKPAAYLPGPVTFVDEPPAAADSVRSDPAAGAPDVAAVFGFDKPTADAPGT